MKNIVIYSKDYCPYCNDAKRLFKSRGWSFTDIEVGYDTALFSEMVNRAGRRSVPQIFSDGVHIGGFDDLEKYLGAAKPQLSTA